MAGNLDMFNANCEEMIIYDLINPKEVIAKCGLEYFKKREKGVVRNCSEYENTVLSVSYDLFKSYSDLFTNSLIVYIQLPQGKQDKVPSQIDYAARDKFLAQNSHITVSVEQKYVKKCVNLVITKIGEYYENCQ